MANVISSDMPGTEETEAMTDEQLESHLAAQEKGTAGVETGDPGQAAPKGGEVAPKTSEAPKAGEKAATGEPAATASATEPKAGDTVTALEAKIAQLESRLQREAGLGAQRALQAKLEKLEAAIERLASPPKTAASPEEQARLDEDAKAQAWLKKNTNPLFEQFLQERLGHLLPVVQQQAIGMGLRDHATELGLEFKDLDPFVGDLILEDDKAARAGDTAAQARMTALANGVKPTELIFRAYRKSLEAAATKAAETAKTAGAVKVENGKAAAGGARLIKSGNPPPQDKVLTKEDIEAMTEDERDKVSDADLERIYPVGRGRR